MHKPWDPDQWRRTNARPRPRSGEPFTPGSAPTAGPDPQPPLQRFTTTLWTYPSQHYRARDGSTAQGDQNYTGATPSWVIWQILDRYTKPGDTVLDPMCGSGTTLDVCRDLGRAGIGFDLAPSRPDIRRNDARRLPLDDATVDLAFIDPPYSTHIRYSDDPACIGTLDARQLDYFHAMDQVIAELARVVRPGGVLALYVSDSWVSAGTPAAPSGVFIPIGFELFAAMRRHGLDAVDIVAVVRGNAKLDKPAWHRAAAEGNYFLRGFNYLFIMRKPSTPIGGRGPQHAARNPRIRPRPGP